MRTALILAVVLGTAFASASAGAANLAFEDQFETYPAGVLGGVGGWKGSGEVVGAPDARLGAQSLGLLSSGAFISRPLPGFYGTVRLDLYMTSVSREDEYVDLEVGSASRLDARVRFGHQGEVRVLQPALGGLEWVAAGSWDAGEIAMVELTVSGGAAMTLRVNGELLFSGLTLDATEENTNVPLEHFAARKSGDGTAYLDNLEVVRNTCSADFQGDGAVDVRDLALLLSVWKDPALTYPDINQNGQIGADDLGILLTQWGSCGG